MEVKQPFSRLTAYQDDKNNLSPSNQRCSINYQIIVKLFKMLLLLLLLLLLAPLHYFFYEVFCFVFFKHCALHTVLLSKRDTIYVYVRKFVTSFEIIVLHLKVDNLLPFNFALNLIYNIPIKILSILF